MWVAPHPGTATQAAGSLVALPPAPAARSQRLHPRPRTFISDWFLSRTRPSKPPNEEARDASSSSLPAAWAAVPETRGWRRWLRGRAGFCGSELLERSGGGADCAALGWCKASCNPGARTRPRSGVWPTSLSNRTRSPCSMVRPGDLPASRVHPRLGSAFDLAALSW